MEDGEAMAALAQYFCVGDAETADALEVVIDEALKVRCFCRSNWLYFWGEIAPIQATNFESVQHLLRWNLARVPQTDDVLAYDPPMATVYLLHRRPLSKLFLDNIFQEAETFTANLAFWVDAFAYPTAVPTERLYVLGY
ncbi:MAG: hypothetical protein LW808_003645 [Verrucomicrobiota bacterium]|nr:MAG: hypothetical protein LW808_003645 [Verrucomicrobiota bacterium]